MMSNPPDLLFPPFCTMLSTLYLCLPSVIISIISWPLTSDWVCTRRSPGMRKERGGGEWVQVSLTWAPSLWGPQGRYVPWQKVTHCSRSTQPSLPVSSNLSLSGSSVAIIPEFPHSSLWLPFISMRKKRQITTKKWLLDWQLNSQ